MHEKYWILSRFPIMKSTEFTFSVKAHPMRPILHLLWQISAGIHRLNWSVERTKSFCISLTANRPVERPKFVSALARNSVPAQENRTLRPFFKFLNLKLHACNFTTVPGFAWVHQKEGINGRKAGEVQGRGVVVATRGCGTSQKGCGFSRIPEITTDHGDHSPLPSQWT